MFPETDSIAMKIINPISQRLMELKDEKEESGEESFFIGEIRLRTIASKYSDISN